MINNPFILVGNIPAPYFCDRQQEIARLIKDFFQRSTKCHQTFAGNGLGDSR